VINVDTGFCTRSLRNSDRRFGLKSLAIAAMLLLAAAAITGDSPVVGEEATIQIRSQHLFPRPVFYATPLGELEFGDVVTLLEECEDWFMIRTASGATGWVHATSVTGAVLSGGSVGSGSTEVTSDEIMLAGRGFNSDMEQSYSSSNPALLFSEVDEMERITVAPEDIYGFLVAGDLIPEEDLPSQDSPAQETPPPDNDSGGGVSRS
jgi:hypothetical protein